MKRCIQCGEVKDESEFYAKQSRCKKCSSKNTVARKHEDLKHTPRKRIASECKCLTCNHKTTEEHDGLKMLVCGQEACFMNCDTCTDRPKYCYWQQHKREEVVNA